MNNTVLISSEKFIKKIDREVIPLLSKKLNLKNACLSEIEKLLNRTSYFVGIKNKIVQKNNVYRLYVELVDPGIKVGKAYHEDSFIQVEGVSTSGIYNILITDSAYFWAKGKISKLTDQATSDTAEHTQYYLYNHHVILELYHHDNCGLFMLRNISTVENAHPILKAHLHLWETHAFENISKWKLVRFEKEDKFKVLCNYCDGTGKVACNKCYGSGKLQCSKCSGTGSLECRRCKSTGYTFFCEICNGTGQIRQEALTCNRCNGTGLYNGTKPCFGCNGTGIFKQARMKECYYCHGRAKETCNKCQGATQVSCYRCEGAGDIECFVCKGSGEYNCSECKGQGYYSCHIKSPKYASECDRQCSPGDNVFLTNDGNDIFIDRQSDQLFKTYNRYKNDLQPVSIKKYSVSIEEKHLNEEFNDIYNYVNLDIQGKKDEFSITQKSIQYHDIVASSNYAYQGQVFKFYLSEPNNGMFKKAEVVEVVCNGKSFIGVINDVNEEIIQLRIYGQPEQGAIAASGKIQHYFLKTPYNYQKSCISTFIEKNSNDLPIKRYLAEIADTVAPPVTSCDGYFNKNVASVTSQKKIVDLSISEPPILLVQGPPGTGKTTVIYEIIRQNLRDPKKKILMCSQSNAAVDNVLDKLFKDKYVSSEIYAVRLGREEAFTTNNAREYLFQSKLSAFQDTLQQGVKNAYEELGSDTHSLAENVNQLNVLVDLGERRDNSNKTLHAFESERKKNELKRDGIINTISKNTKLKEDLIDKIQKSENNIFKKSIYGILSVVKQDPKNKLQAVESNISELELNKKECSRSINEQIRNETEIKNDINSLEKQIAGYPDEFADMAMSNVAELTKKRDGISGLLNKKQTTYSLLIEWKGFIETGQEALANYLRKKANLVFSTCIGIHGDEYFNDINFDLVIIDESSRSTVMEIIVPMIRGKRFILVGDHLQLPPTLSRRTAELCRDSRSITKSNGDNIQSYINCLNSKYCDRCYYGQSYFEEMFRNPNLSDSLKVRLDTQFRMHPDIADFISETFYNNSPLKNGTNTNDNVIPISEFPHQIHFISTASHGKKKHETKKGFGKENMIEAQKVCEIVASIAREIKSPITMGILSFYKAQVELIKRIIDQNKTDISLFKEMEIASLDSFQGKEKDIIIISFVRSPKNIKMARLDFVLEFKRLNVAISRASKKLIIVGDIPTLEKYSKEMESRIDIIGSLTKYIKKRGSEVPYWNKQ
jgi:superfamily I DNA and/or RNA helicase